MFINKVYNMMEIMGVSFDGKDELAAYQLNGLSHVRFKHWESERVEEGLID